MAGLVEGIRGLFARKRQSAAEAYDELVRKAASGKSGSAEDAAAILEAVGKTVDDLERDADIFKTRRAKAATLGQRDQLVAERKELLTEREQAQVEHDEMMRKGQERIRELDVRIGNIGVRINGIDNARLDLVATAPVELQDRRKTILAERSEQLRARGRLRDQVSQQQALFSQAEQRLANSKPENHEYHERELNSARLSLPRLEADLLDAETNVERLESELAAIKEEMAAA